MSRADLEALLREGYAQRAASVSEASLPPELTEVLPHGSITRRAARSRWIAPLVAAAVIAAVAVGLTMSASARRHRPAAPAPSTIQSTPAPRPSTPVSAVLDDVDGNAGTTGAGTWEQFEEVRNISKNTVTLAGPVEVQVPPTVPMKVVAALVGTGATGLQAPTPVSSIRPGQVVDVWVELRADCTKVSTAHEPLAAPVVLSVKLVGYTGAATYPLDDQIPGPSGPTSLGGPSVAQQACGINW